MGKGDVARLNHDFSRWEEQVPLEPSDLHVAACLLSHERALALDAQIVLPGILRSRRARNAELHTQAGSMDMARHVESSHARWLPCVWQPLRLCRAPLRQEARPPARIVGDWETGLLETLSAITVAPDVAKVRVRQNPRASVAHKAVVRAGAVSTVEGKTFAVLSNDVIHEGFGGARALVAPVLRREFSPASPLLTRFPGGRVLWEHATMVDWTVTVRLTFSEATALPREVLDAARQHFLSLVSGLTPKDVSEAEYLAYLKRSVQDLRREQAPTFRWSEPDKGSKPEGHQVDSHAEVAAPGRMLTAGAASIGGESYIPLKLANDLFNVWLHRSGDDVELLVEAADSNVNAVQIAWVETEEGRVQQTAMAESIDEAGVARIGLGKVNMQKPLSFTLGASSPLGVQEFTIRHTWRWASR